MKNTEKTKEQLLKEIEKYRTLVETIEEGLGNVDENETFTFVNQAAADIFGYSKDEMIGKNLKELTSPEMFQKILEETSTRQKGDSGSYKLQILRKDGEQRIITVTATPIVTENGIHKGSFGIFHDITELKQSEEALRESEARFRKLLENITTVAVQGYTADGIINYWNKANELIYGYTAEEAIGKNLVDLIIPPEIRKDIQEIIKHGAKTGEMPPATELTLMRKDGNPVTVFSSHAVVQQSGKEPLLFCMDMDLTERKQAEEAIQKNEEKYRLLADNSLDMIWQMDLKLVFTYTSPSVKDAIGYTVDEWVGSSLSHHATRKEFFKMAREALKAIKNYKKFTYLTFEAVMLKKDGTEIPVEITAKLLLNKRGLPIGLQGTTRVITERKQAEEILKESEKKLTQIIEGSSTPIFVINKNHIVTHWNKACENLTGVSAKKMTGTKKHWTAFYSAERPLLADIIVDNFTEAEIAKYYNNKFRKSTFIEGAYDCEDFYPELDNKWLFFTAAPLKNQKGNVVGAIETFQDITERKLVEEELAKHRKNLERLVKERTTELEKSLKDVERMNELFVGREFRIKELRDKVKELEKSKNENGRE